MCERTLNAEWQICLAKTAAESALTYNTSTFITLARMSAQKCIEYCRGGGQAADSDVNRYAVVGTEDCVCAKGPLNLDLDIPPTIGML
jgi:hypothetical protein